MFHQKGQQKINFVHTRPFDENDFIKLQFKVKSYFVEQTVKAKCAACGQPCGGRFMGRDWTMDMPACPVPAGTWSFSLPLLPAEIVEELPPVPKFQMDAKVKIQRSADDITA